MYVFKHRKIRKFVFYSMKLDKIITISIEVLFNIAKSQHNKLEWLSSWSKRGDPGA